MKLVISDLSNIEGRILAWIAGEEWKLQAFRDYDAGRGPDLYNITATSIIGGDPYHVEKKNRNVFGKVPDLAGGYEGGVGAYQQFAKSYGVKMFDHWETIQQGVAPDVIARACDNYETWGRARAAASDMDIDRDEWIASETIKLAWRDRHPATVSLWRACKDAAIAAIRTPGSGFRAGPHLAFHCTQHASGSWLLVSLPSGRFLTYYDPRVDWDNNITYMGMGDEDGAGGNRVWCRLYTYGGKSVENACQAIAGDILKASMPSIEAAGYEIVLTVHDEDVTQAPDLPQYSAADLSGLIATPPIWAPDLPLAAAGFESYRYKKED
jgi:DNA polymerase